MRKYHILTILIWISLAGRAQLVGINEGSVANCSALLELPGYEVIAGINAHYYGEGFGNFTLVKFSKNGTVDERFGENGKFRLKEHVNSQRAQEELKVADMILLPEGKIMVAGNRTQSGSSLFLLRLQQDGQIDSSFGKNGLVFINDTYLDDGYYYIRVFPTSDNQKYLVAYVTYGGRFGSARVDGKGEVDMDYGSGKGVFSFDKFASNYPQNSFIAKDPSDRLYFLEYITSDESTGRKGHMLKMLRTKADGNVDESYGENGSVELLSDPANRLDYKAGNLVFMPDKKVLLTAKSLMTYSDDRKTTQVVMMLDENGKPDPSFGTNGQYRFTMEPGEERGFSSVKLMPDGKLLISQIAKVATNDSYSMVLVSKRLNKNGKLDAGYGKKGLALNPLMQASNYLLPAGMQWEKNNLYVFGDFNSKGGSYLSVFIRMELMAEQKFRDIMTQSISYKDSSAGGTDMLVINDVSSNATMNAGDISLTKGNTGGKEPTQEERNLMAMISKMTLEAQKVQTAFDKFDRNQMNGAVISKDFIPNAKALIDAMKNYSDLHNTQVGVKASIRSNMGWKNFVTLSRFKTKEQELVDEMTNLARHLVKCAAYIDQFNNDKGKMPSGVGNVMEMADYNFNKRIKEFLSTYKSIPLE